MPAITPVRPTEATRFLRQRRINPYAESGGGGGFSPPAAANLFTWIEADLESYANSDPAPSFTDFGSRAQPFGLGGGGDSAIFNTNFSDGRAAFVITNNGASSPYYSNAEFASFNLANRTVIMVMSESTHIDNAGFLIFAPTSGNDYNGNDGMLYHSSTAENRFEAIGGSGFPYVVGHTGTNAGAKLWTEVVNAGSGALYLSNAGGTSATPVATDSWGSFTTVGSGTAFLSGRYNSSIDPSAGPSWFLQLLVIYNVALSTAQRQVWWDYVLSRYPTAAVRT